jgi:hypothetical protein
VTGIAELERHVATIVPPAAATGWRLTVVDTHRDGTTYGVVPIIAGRRDGALVFTGTQRDCHLLYDLLHGHRPTLRSAPHSVAEPAQALGPAERGAVPSGRRPTSSLVDSRTPSRPLAGGLNGIEVASDAGSPGASIDTHSGPGIKPSGVAATRSSDAPAAGSSDGGAAGSASGIASASPGPKRCAACGRDLSTLPPSPMSARRTTCSDACRQAYRRGHRAPIAAVVDEETVERLSRLPDRFISGFGRGDPDPAPDPRQLVIPLPPAGAGTDPGRDRPPARVLTLDWPVDHEYGE